MSVVAYFKQAIPAAGNNILYFANQTVTMMAVGRYLGATSLGHFALGLSLFNLAGLSLAFGFATALDTLASQTKRCGGKHSKMLGVLFQLAIVLTFASITPVIVSFSFAAAPHQRNFEKELALGAASFLKAGIPLLIMTGLMTCIQKVLQARHAHELPTIARSVGVVVCPLAARVLVPAFGVPGAISSIAIAETTAVIVVTIGAILDPRVVFEGNVFSSSPLLSVRSTYNDAAATQRAIDAGADVNAQRPDGRRALHFASAADVAALLIKHGANVGARCEKQSTALHTAAEAGRVDVARVLLDSGADVHAVDVTSRTPLHKAVHKNHSAVVRLLLHRKADVNARDDGGHTPLRLIVSHGCVAAATVLLQHGADVASRSGRRGQSIVHAAVTNRQWKRAFVRLLIDHGADVDFRDMHGWTPLHIGTSVSLGRSPAAFLLQNGADVNARDPDGWNALHFAAMHDNFPVAKLLVMHGALTNVADEGEWARTRTQ